MKRKKYNKCPTYINDKINVGDYPLTTSNISAILYVVINTTTSSTTEVKMAQKRKQNKSPMKKFTFKNFLEMFPNDDVCLDYIRYKKYPERIDCPECGKNALFHRVKGRKSYACDFCGYQISPTAGTIFHKSRTSLTTWFYVIYLVAQTRGGISAKQIERETGVTYKTAWRMCKLVRESLEEDYSPFGGEVEILTKPILVGSARASEDVGQKVKLL